MPLYNQKAGSPISKNNHVPTRNIPALKRGSIHNFLIFFPANTPQKIENKGFIAKNNTKQTAIPAVPAKVTANHGHPIIKISTNIIQLITFLICRLSIAPLKYFKDYDIIVLECSVTITNLTLFERPLISMTLLKL